MRLITGVARASKAHRRHWNCGYTHVTERDNSSVSIRRLRLVNVSLGVLGLAMLVVAVVLDVRANTVRKPSEDHVVVCQYVPVVFILLLGALGSRRAGIGVPRGDGRTTWSEPTVEITRVAERLGGEPGLPG